jgi:competence protein ComEC
MPRWCAIGLAVPLAAQLTCTPVIAAISGQVSLVAVLANVLAGPAVAPATILGLIGGVVSLVSVPAGHLIGVPTGWCADWILTVGHQSAALPGASTDWNGPLWLLGLLCLLGVAAIVWLGARPALLCGLGIGLLVCLWRPPTPGWPAPGWVMVACDVGQGDATILNAAPGLAVVVDAGPDPAAVDGCLRRMGIEHVALMVFTHAHADHIGGWVGVRRHRQVDEIMVGPTGGPATDGIPRRRAILGESFTVGTMDFEVIGPMEHADFPAGAETESAANNASIVLRVTSSGFAIMLSGDAEPEEQEAILREDTDLGADVLKMPHHGSARQSEEFFTAVGARIATISDGVDNDYGHPAPAALRLLKKLHIATYRTDEQGDIAIVVRGGALSVLTR